MKTLACTLAAVVLCLFSVNLDAAVYSDGDGSASNPYQIGSVADWQTLMATPDDWGQHFILTDNLNMTGVSMTPVGNYTTKFTGTFNGNSHTISNLNYSSSSLTTYVGLFGYTLNATINDLNLADIQLTPLGRYVGALAGYCSRSTIINCTSTGLIIVDSTPGVFNYSIIIGGLLGQMYEGTLSGSSSACDIGVNCDYYDSPSYSLYAGGLVGDSNGTITGCFSTGSVTVDVLTTFSNNFTYAGGFAGGLSNNVTNCYSRGSVSCASEAHSATAYIRAGGFVGYAGGTGLTNCYSTGSVWAAGGDIGIGGFQGGGSGTGTACFWDTDTSNQSSSAGGSGVTGLPTTDMQTLSTYTSTGWDFTGDDSDAPDWYMNGTAYPQLIWEFAPVSVPNVVEMTQADAQTAIVSVNLAVGEVTEAYSDTVPAGYIISQSPIAGTSVYIGTPVDLVVSLGGASTVPDIIGFTQADAETFILAANHTVGQVTQQCSDTVPAGYVISQSPAGGTEAAWGTSVDMIVSTGMTIVPNVIEMSQIDAEDVIAAAGFLVDESCDYSDTITAGYVISQSPDADTLLCAGSSMSMVLSLGKAVVVPDLYNIHIDDAANLLYVNELTLGSLQTGYNRSIPEHHVISQSPAAGQIVPAGTPINLIFVGGWGWEDDPFHIWTAEQLNSIGQNPADWGGYFKLMADIDMSAYTGTQYNIIGNDINPFGGVFDGNGHTISNLTYTTTDGLVSAGLFGVTGAATIKDVHLKDVSISAASYAGALIGYQSDGQVLRCSSTGSVAASNFSAVYVGGLIGGVDWGGDVTNCRSSCTVTASADAGASCAGGLVGLHHGGFISRSFATGSVSASGNAQSMAGGIAGSVEYGGSVKFCYASGSVSAASDENQSLAGGVAGYVIDGLFTDNYSIGAVTSTSIADSSIAGGLVGMRDWGNAERCYSTGIVTSNGAVESIAGGLAGIGEGFIACFWDTDTSNQSESAGGEDVFGKTTAEMKTQATFTNTGWDFANETLNDANDIWRMCTDGADYPKLNWQSIDGDFACPAGVDSADLDYFFQQWLFTDCSADNNFCSGADLNASGTVDMADFMIFAEHWLEGI